jgi:hypothetical protein
VPHTGGPPSPLPRPLPLSPLPASTAAVGCPTAAHLPSTLLRERLWAIPQLRSTFPPLQRRLWAIPRLLLLPPPHKPAPYTAGRVAERSTP